MSIPPPPRRFEFIAAMRIAAAIAIAWEHTPESRPLAPTAYFATFAVPFFTMGSIFLLFESLRRKPERPFPSYVASRFNRLYLPMLAWSCVYLLIRILKSAALHRPFVHPMAAWVLIGSAHHLWFLPFLFLTCIAMFYPARWIGNARVKTRIAAAIAAIAAAIVLGCLAHSAMSRWITDLGMAYFVDRATAAAPAIFLGVALGAVYPLWPGVLRNSTLAWIGLLGCAACQITGYVLNPDTVGWENFGGLGFMLFALAPWESASVRRIAGWGQFAFGFYLAHVAFIEGLQTAATMAHLHGSPAMDVGVFAGAVIGTLGLVVLLSQSRMTSWLIPDSRPIRHDGANRQIAGQSFRAARQ